MFAYGCTTQPKWKKTMCCPKEALPCVCRLKKNSLLELREAPSCLNIILKVWLFVSNFHSILWGISFHLSLVTVAWYTTPSFWQSPPTGHVGTPPLQLHPGVGCCSSTCLAIWLFGLLLAWPILSMQQYPIFTVLLLIIFARGWNGGKQESINLRNLAPTLVLTFKEKGEWKYVTFLEFLLFPPFVFWGGQNLSW